MFRYGTTNADGIKLKLFPSSLAGDAKVWFNELSPDVIATWEQIRQAFVSEFFPPAMFNRILGEIRGFTQHPNESLVDAWLRMKDLLRSCNGHGLGRGTIIQSFTIDLTKPRKLSLILEESFSTKPLTSTPIDRRLKDESLASKIDSQFKDIKGEMKEMRDGCSSCGGPHPSLKCDDKPMGGPKDEDANYAEEVIEEEDIEETTMVEIPEIDETCLTYDPPVNPNSNTTVIHDDSEDEVDEAEKEVEPSSSKQTKSDPPPLKTINIPLVDVLGGMHNYGKFLKDLVSNKSKMEQIFVAFLNEERSEVIVNGDSPLPKRTVDGVEQTYPPTTAEEKLARKNELKARAIEKRFGGNKESKKTQKTLLKQQYENFNGSSSEGLDQTYDRLQNLISQLEFMGETISQEDMNLKFLRSLLSKWKIHTLI
ncbi:reverse transcriptase domain-containing protein [Tanacetum coccineum]